MVYNNLTVREIDWNKAINFTELNQRPDIIGVVPELIYYLQTTRELLNKPIIVSPNPKAIVATDGHSAPSQHYKGRAIDWFPECDPYTVLSVLMKYNPWTGIGFYFDTTLDGQFTKMMVHTDIRVSTEVTSKVMWIRNKNRYDDKGYFYLGTDCNWDESKFLKELIDNIQDYIK